MTSKRKPKIDIFRKTIPLLLFLLFVISCGGGGGGEGGGTFSGPLEYTISSSSGGSLNFSSEDAAISLSFPAGAVSTDTMITVDSSASIYDSNVIPGLGFRFLPEGLVFDEPVTIVVTYDEADLGGADETELKIHRWADPDWQRLPSTVDTTANTVTATLTGFSEYFLFPAVRKLYFNANTGTTTYRTFSWDGQAAVMASVLGSTDGSYTSAPWGFVEFRDKLYYVMNEHELWSYDGAQARMAATLGLIGGSGAAWGLLPFNDKLYFLGQETTRWELWSYSDEDGLVQETDSSHTETYMPQSYMVYDGMIYFEGREGINNREIWRFDVDTRLAEQVCDINTGSSHSEPDGMTVFNGTLYFSADDGVHGRELWAYNSTSDICTMVKEIFPGDQNDDGILNQDEANQFIPFNAEMYFAAYSTIRSPLSANALWVSDGTAEGTTAMHYPIDGFALHNLFGIYPVDDLLYFYGGGSYGATYLGGLWMYDPADATTPRVIGNNVNGVELIRWNDLWYFMCRPEISPGVYTDYHGLCSSDGISEQVMQAHFSTNLIYSQQIYLNDSISY